MKYIPFLFALIFLVSSCKQNTVSTKTEFDGADSIKRKVSYALGMTIAYNLKAQPGFNLDSAFVEADFKRGIQDAMNESKANSSFSYATGALFARNYLSLPGFDSIMDADYITKGIAQYVKDTANLAMKLDSAAYYMQFYSMDANTRGLAMSNLEKGKAFMKKMKEEGMLQTASGLLYKELKPGTSTQKPGPYDNVTVRYTGKTFDGQVFDSTDERGPQKFVVLGVVKGWQEGLQLMTVGSKYRFVIPPSLGYGLEAKSPILGPNMTMDFEVELISIEAQKTEAQPNPQLPGR